MGRRKVEYYQVTCDYPEHGVITQLATGAGYRVFDGDIVICYDCWNGKLIVEVLIKLLSINMFSAQVGQEKK